MTKARVWIVALLLAGVVALAAAPAAVSKDGDDVRVAGTCTKASTSKLKLSDEDGRIEVEFEVDQNRRGVRWTIVLMQNGKSVARLTRVTKAPSGSFEARVLTTDTADQTDHGKGYEPIERGLHRPSDLHLGSGTRPTWSSLELLSELQGRCISARAARSARCRLLAGNPQTDQACSRWPARHLRATWRRLD